MKRTRIFQRNVAQENYHSLCKCGQPITLYFNGGELDGKTCQCGRRYFLECKRLDVMVTELPAKGK